jgi:hypothetical protein
MMNKISHEYDLLRASRCGNEGKEKKAIVLRYSVRTLTAKVLSRAWKSLKFSSEYSFLLKTSSNIYMYSGRKFGKIDKKNFLCSTILII